MRIIIPLIAASAMAAVAAPSYAAPWQNINQRQANLDRRIDAGVRSGDLTRAEARQLRTDYRALSRLEARYRSGGLSAWERNDLDRRFDGLSARIRVERHDRQERGDRGGKMNINQRQERLDARIDAGVRSGELNWSEAARLRSDYRALERLESNYRRGGLSAWERRDLNRRFDSLSTRIRLNRNDRDQFRWW